MALQIDDRTNSQQEVCSLYILEKCLSVENAATQIAEMFIGVLLFLDLCSKLKIKPSNIYIINNKQVYT